MNTQYFARPVLLWLLFTVCTGFHSAAALAQDTAAQAVGDARLALDAAGKAGAARDAAADFSTAKSWMSQAESAYASHTSVVGQVATAKMKKAREDEVIYLATMAKVKARTAEARAKRVSTLAEIKAVEKNVADFQGAISVAQGAISVAREQQEASRKAEAELGAALQRESARTPLAEKEAAANNAHKEKLALMQAKLQALEQEKAMLVAAGEIPNSSLRSAKDRIIVSIPAINLFTPANEITPAGKKILDSAGGFLKAYPARRVIIHGHTDNRGPAAVNLDVSEKRAQRVRAYLVGSQNLPSARLDAAGMGDAEPVATNATDAGRALNRRVEVTILLGE